MKFVQHKLLRETKANLLNASWSPNLIPLPRKKNPSCQRIITQLSTDVTFHAGKEEPNLQKNHIQIHISLNLGGSRRKRKKKKLFQITSIKLHEGCRCYECNTADSTVRRAWPWCGSFRLHLLPLGQPWDIT